MTESRFGIVKRSSVPFIIIILVVVIGAVFILSLVQKSSIESIMKKDEPMGILFIFEKEKKPVSNQLLIWYPSRRKAAIMDIPSSMGIILKTANAMNSIDSVYDPKDPRKFVQEISEYLKFPIAGWFVFDEQSLAKTVDLLGVFNFFFLNQ